MKSKLRGEKPIKLKDSELWFLLEEKITAGNYFFVAHAKKRLTDRDITDTDVLDILENINNKKRKRNKSKDTYISGYQNWNYCIEGNDLDGNKLRIIISFDNELMLVITVIRIVS